MPLVAKEGGTGALARAPAKANGRGRPFLQTVGGGAVLFHRFCPWRTALSSKWRSR